jgi:hypothetical protein
MAPLFAVGAQLAVQCVEGVPPDAVLKGAGLAPDGNFGLVFEHESFDLVPANSAALPVIAAYFKPLEQPAPAQPVAAEARIFRCPTCGETESVPWHEGLTVRCSTCQVDAILMPPPGDYQHGMSPSEPPMQAEVTDASV